MAAGESRSFSSHGSTLTMLKKVKTRIPYIKGTRPSVQNVQINTSSGIPSLDNIIGSGLPVGSTLLIEEDVAGTYSQVILKYFLAEGAACGHSLYLASKDVDPSSIIEELPRPINMDSHAADKGEMRDTHSSNENLTIAWRYQNMSTPSALENVQLGHNFDLSQTLPKEELLKCNLSTWNGVDQKDPCIGGFINPLYGQLLASVKDNLASGKYRVGDEPEEYNILRIGIMSLGSPHWVPPSANTPSSSTDLTKDLPKFFLCLRAILHKAYAVAVVTVPSHLFKDPVIVLACLHHSDVAVQLESFAGSAYETNPAFKEYHGLFHVKKIGVINTLLMHVPGSLDLAFKLRRKKFVIEKLHLPPELQETSEREQDDIGSPLQSSGMSCGSSRSNKLDF